MAAEQIRPAVSYRQEMLFLICRAGRIGKGGLSIAIGDVRYGRDADHRSGGRATLACWTRTELPTTSGTFGIEKDCSAPSGLGG
jgi:hypothetical protein